MHELHDGKCEEDETSWKEREHDGEWEWRLSHREPITTDYLTHTNTLKTHTQRLPTTLISVLLGERKMLAVEVLLSVCVL